MATTIKGVVGGGVVFSASPATEIVIPSGYLLNESNIFDDIIVRTITIPNGVKVIDVGATINGIENDIWLEIRSNNKRWLYMSDLYNEVSLQGYIGVSPNKQYTVTLIGSANSNTVYDFSIEYSPEINNKTPTVTDY